jgi:hypothetical protein
MLANTLSMATSFMHDPGGESTRQEFQIILQNSHFRDVCTTARNPQSNAASKRMHQMVGNILRTLLHIEPLPHMVSTKEYVNEALSISYSTGTCSLIFL